MSRVKNAHNTFLSSLGGGEGEGEGVSAPAALVRYDNEVDKGDHRRYGNREEPYRFIDVETLVRDFLADIARLKGGVQ